MGAAYEIHVRTRNTGAIIRLNNADVYDAVVDRLWRSVGARLFFEHVGRLKRGGRLVYPGVVIEDNAITLTRKRKFGRDEEIRLTWDNARFLSTDRYLIIGIKGDDKITAVLSYTKTDNVCVLEHMIGLFVDRGKTRISDLLS